MKAHRPRASLCAKPIRFGAANGYMNGLAFDLATPHGRMLATIIAGIAEFERELIQERTRAGRVQPHKGTRCLTEISLSPCDARAFCGSVSLGFTERRGPVIWGAGSRPSPGASRSEE